MGADRTRELGLIRDVIAGVTAARRRFIAVASEPAWKACKLLTCDEDEAGKAFEDFMDALRSDNFRKLGSYDGRSSLET
ncbi:hypothetical protein H261_19476, partial [Paramagnetospirillum caucaseum]